MLNNRDKFFHSSENWLNIIFWLICLSFTGSVVYLCLQFPSSDAALLPNISKLLFCVAILTGLVACVYFLLRFRKSRGDFENPGGDRLRAVLVEYAPGLLLALLFLIAYFSLAATLGVLPDDNFYDTDASSWLNRFSAPADELIEMRPVHPFAFLIFRPLVWFVSLLMGGDKYLAALALNAGAGALCVFLAWWFIGDLTRNKILALMVAALLGVTTSHLILSASLESYIFSAAALIAFLILMTRANPSLKTLTPAGLLTFGITITNFIQTLIMFVCLDLKPVKIAKYTALVIALSIILAFLQVRLYPTSQPFYIPSNLLAEDRYSFNPLNEGLPRTMERAHVLGRTISLFNVVAPRPLVLLEETGCTFPCFQTYKHRWNGALINSYVGLGSFLARTWFLILLLAGGSFAWRLTRSPGSVRLQTALLGCILFNFVLHMNYGDDPMLYSGDWTYAVVFFTALSCNELADKKWFQAGALAFIAALMINNWRFLHAVLKALSPYLSS